MLNSVVERTIDLKIPNGKIPWQHNRSYDSRSARYTGTFVDQEGCRWFGSATNQYLRWDQDGEGNDYEYIQLFADARALRTFDYNSTLQVFTSPPDSPYVLTRSNAGTVDELFTLRNTETGEVLVFYGLDLNVIPEENRGRLKELTNVALQADEETGITFSYRNSSDELLEYALTAEGWLIDYDYYAGPTAIANNLKSISVYDGPSPTSDTLIAKAEYLYFDNVDIPLIDKVSLGSSGDLVQVTVSQRATDDANGDLSIKRTTQYRYHLSPHAHQIKAVFEADAVQRMMDHGSFISTKKILEEADADTIGPSGDKIKIEDFASRSFEHHSTSDIQADPYAPETTFGNENLQTKYGGYALNYQFDPGTWDGAVSSESIGADCASCGGGLTAGIRREYYYLELQDWYGDLSSPPEKAGIDEPNQAVRIVIEDTVDSNDAARYRKITSVNYKGMWLRKAFLTAPLSAPDDTNAWFESRILDDEWRIVEHRMPSAHKGKITSDALIKEFLDPYDPGAAPGQEFANDAATVQSAKGVVYHYAFTEANDIRTKAKQVSEGTGGDKHYLYAIDYGDGDNDDEGLDHTEKNLIIARHAYPEQTDDLEATSRITTSYEYTFWDDSASSNKDFSIKTIETTLPAVATSENGSGVSTVTYDFIDTYGRRRWHKDGEGVVTYYSYHPFTGGLAYVMVDVETDDLPSDITSGSSGKWENWPETWTLPTEFASTDDGNLQLVTKYEYDELGRVTKSIDPGGSEHVRKYYADGVAQFPYVSGTTAGLPVRVRKTNDGGQMLSRFSVKSSAFKTDASSIPSSSSNYVGLTEYGYDKVSGQLELVERYYDIANSGSYSTTILYDELGRRAAAGQEVSTGKFQWNVMLLDLRGRGVETRRGVSSSNAYDFADLSDTISSTPPSNFDGYATAMTAEYDEGKAGDGHLTKRTVTNTVNTSHAIEKYTETHYHLTYRGDVRGIKRRHYDGSSPSASDVKPYQAFDIDWRGNTVAEAIYSSEPSWTTLKADYDAWVNDSSGATGRYGLTVHDFDALNRNYQTKKYPGTQSTSYHLTERYYDRKGQLVAEEEPYGVSTEYAYDGADRLYQTRTVTQLQSTKYSSGAFQYAAPAPDPAIADMPGTGDDGVIQIEHSVFDADGYATEEHTFELVHTDTDGIDIDATDSYVRRSVYHWYDGADRREATADYGSGDTASGAGEWKYAAIPTRTNDALEFTDADAYNGKALLMTYGYDADSGRQDEITNGVRKDTGNDTVTTTTKTYYDDLGRRTFVVENENGFSESNPTGTVGGGTDNEENRATGFVYNGLNKVTDLTAYNASSSTGNQTTKYWYEDDYNASLNTHAAYPDSSSTPSSGTDLVKTEYRFDGSLDTHTDQRGVVMTYSYDDARRLELEVVTTIPAGVDDGVEAIGWTYDDYGRLETVTSYDGTTTASTVKNQIKHTYDANHGRLIKTEQNHTTSVGAGTPATEYEYDESASGGVYTDGLRLDETDYPVVADARVQWYYDSAGSINDRLHRVRYHKLWDGDLQTGTKTHTVRYNYNGLGRMTRMLSESGSFGTNTSLNYYSGTAGNYSGWDRFGRIVLQKWNNPATSAIVDRFEYEYDYASNRTARNLQDDSVQDQDYTYDGLHRLKSVDVDTTTNTTDDRYWTLDQLGNWEELHHNTDGTGAADEVRTHNDANELTAFTTPGANTNPGYDAAGNMTTMPQPGDLTASYTAKYDAWNRLVSLDDSGAVASYEYDGLGRRIKRTEGSTDTHFYYNEEWQVVTETDGTYATAIYSYNPDYVDSLAVRMTPTDDHFFTHDALYNVTSAVDASTDSVVERYAYTPYGEATVLDANYSADGDGASDIDNEILFTGRRVDPGTGLQLNRHRYYHQLLGRWTTRDPIEYWGGISLISYVASRPTVFFDSTGLEAATIGGGIYWGGGVAISVNPVAAAGAAVVAGPVAGYYCGCEAERKFGIGEAIGNWLVPPNSAECRSLPLQGPRGGIIQKPGQTREYDEDGYPKTDVDVGHDHGAGDPHAHDWGRPAGGGPPTHKDRGPGRPLRKGDPPLPPKK